MTHIIEQDFRSARGAARSIIGLSSGVFWGPPVFWRPSQF